MIDQNEIIWGIIVPPLLMAVGVVTLGALPITHRYFSVGAWLTLVYAVCHLGLRKWPSFGVNVHDWPVWIALAIGALAWRGGCTTAPWWLRALTRAVLISVAVWFMLRPQYVGMSTEVALLWSIGLVIPWVMTQLLWERAYEKLSPDATTMGLMLVALLSSVSLLLFNVLLHAQLAGIVTAILVTIGVFTRLRPSWLMDRTVVTVVAMLLPALWILGVRYADLPIWGAGVLAVTGLVPWLTASARLAARPAWQRLAIQVVAMFVVSSPIIVWGVVTTLRAMSESEYGY